MVAAMVRHTARIRQAFCKNWLVSPRSLHDVSAQVDGVLHLLYFFSRGSLAKVSCDAIADYSKCIEDGVLERDDSSLIFVGECFLLCLPNSIQVLCDLACSNTLDDHTHELLGEGKVIEEFCFIV